MQRHSADARSERGQLVVITGLVLAVVLVGLVLVVNTAIYTENLATRDPDVGDENALAYADSVRVGVGGVIDRENENEYETDEEVRDGINDSAGVLNDNLSRTHVERGVDAHVNESSISYSEGRLIRQTNESRDFKSAIELLENWDVVHDVNDTRAFGATVPRSSLTSTTDDDVDGEAFHVVVTGNDTDYEWAAYVYENSSTNEIAVAVENDSEVPVEQCSTDADAATVDFTAGTLDDESCPGFVWAGGDAPDGYDIRFENAGSARGTYDLTVGTYDQDLLNTAQLNDGPDSNGPYYVPAVYDAEVEITYRTTDLLFETTLRIAPGEPDA